MKTPPTSARSAISDGGNVVKMQVCQFPGCRETVRKNYITHLCAEHAHTPNLCRCRKCWLRDNKQAAQDKAKGSSGPPRRKDVRTFKALLHSHGDDPRRIAHVSLPIEPWARQATPDTPPENR